MNLFFYWVPANKSNAEAHYTAVIFKLTDQTKKLNVMRKHRMEILLWRPLNGFLLKQFLCMEWRVEWEQVYTNLFTCVSHLLSASTIGFRCMNSSVAQYIKYQIHEHFSFHCVFLSLGQVQRIWVLWRFSMLLPLLLKFWEEIYFRTAQLL